MDPTKYWRVVTDAEVPPLLRGQFVYSLPNEKFLHLPLYSEDLEVLAPNRWLKALQPDEEATARFLTDLSTEEVMEERAAGAGDLAAEIRHLAELRGDLESAWMMLCNHVKPKTGKDIDFGQLALAETEAERLRVLHWNERHPLDDMTQRLLDLLEDVVGQVAEQTAKLVQKEG